MSSQEYYQQQQQGGYPQHPQAVNNDPPLNLNVKWLSSEIANRLPSIREFKYYYLNEELGNRRRI
jgi:hypothetical protein